MQSLLAYSPEFMRLNIQIHSWAACELTSCGYLKKLL